MPQTARLAACSRSFAAPLMLALALPGSCQRTPKKALAPTVQPVDLARRDLKSDLDRAKAALGGNESPLYACDRLAVAERALADQHDADSERLRTEADQVCGFQVPVKLLKDVLREGPSGCGRLGNLVPRVQTKFTGDPTLVELVRDLRAICPRPRSLGGSHGHHGSSGSGSAAAGAQQESCRRRCDDAAFSCRAHCDYCGTCTNDKTWEWCNATCNTCRRGCEQNEQFCKASCGG
jgi:hypothetical protein